MADEDYGDDDAFYFDDDDYLYVEDDYAIAVSLHASYASHSPSPARTRNRLSAIGKPHRARNRLGNHDDAAGPLHSTRSKKTDWLEQDELAETQVPSPGYTGVNDEIANESFEYDVYEYFGELEYGSDSYWDARIKHLASVRAGEKRKSGADEEEEAALLKKRRKDDGLEARDNVVFMPFEARLAPLPSQVHEEERFALLPDWKERFPERLDDGSPTEKGKQMPADMRRAAEAEDEEDDEAEQGDALNAHEDEMEVDSHEDEEDDGTDAGVDQDVIMQVLRQKLADSGLGDVDESVFKDAIAKMLSGEGDGEDALGGLASLLLGQKDGGGKAFEGFLAGQGVDVNRAEDEDEDENQDGDQDTENNDQEEGDSQPSTQTLEPTGTAQTKTRSRSGNTPSTSTATANHKTPMTRGKSKATSPTTATMTNTKPKPASPIVVPSPPPLSFKSSRKRRAPSLDEPALPQPEAPSSSAKPAAKRRRTPHAEPPTNEPETVPSTAPATGRRTTRSAAAAGKGGR